MVYTTKADVNDLAQFYIRECPAADWELLTVVQADGAELTFRKQQEQLVIKITGLGVTRGNELVLNLTPIEPGT